MPHVTHRERASSVLGASLMAWHQQCVMLWVQNEQAVAATAHGLGMHIRPHSQVDHQRRSTSMVFAACPEIVRDVALPEAEMVVVHVDEPVPEAVPSPVESDVIDQPWHSTPPEFIVISAQQSHRSSQG
jgi:hypothetical protein